MGVSGGCAIRIEKHPAQPRPPSKRYLTPFPAHWQSGCGAFSVSAADVEEVVEYITQQESHHRVVSFQEEFQNLLDAHGIAYDERYVWD